MPTIALISKYATAITMRVAAIRNARSPVSLLISEKDIKRMPARSNLAPRVIAARLDRELPAKFAKHRS